MMCFLAQFAPETVCEGRLIRAHLLPRSLLKREFGKTLGKKLAEDPRSFVLACGGSMGNSGHHGAFDTARTLRVPRSAIPYGTEVMARELGLDWYLEREYGPLVDHVCPGCGNRRSDPSQLCLPCRMGLAS